MIDLPESANLKTEFDNGWLSILFNRPDNRNALSTEMVTDITAVLTAVRDDRRVRGISFRGAGGVFCAGGDLKGFQKAFSSPNARQELAELSAGAGRFFDLTNDMPQVTVMLLEGAAMAGGFGIACCGDVVIAHADTKFALTETQLGITPAQIAPFVLNRLGAANGRRLMLTAAKFTAQTAPLGLIDFIVDDEAGLKRIEQQIKDQVLTCAPGAVAETKALIRDCQLLDRDAFVRRAADGFAASLAGDEGREGIMSFLQKRKPAWHGGQS